MTTSRVPVTARPPAPREEPDALVDLLADCREVSGVLGLPSSPVPPPRPGAVVDISAATAADYADWSPYGA